jgi:hypothetical protein
MDLGGAHRGKAPTARSGGSGVQRRAVLVVLEACESDDGVPLDAPETMVRRRRRVFPGTGVRHDWRSKVRRWCRGHGRTRRLQGQIGGRDLTRSHRSSWRL